VLCTFTCFPSGTYWVITPLPSFAPVFTAHPNCWWNRWSSGKNEERRSAGATPASFARYKSIAIVAEIYTYVVTTTGWIGTATRATDIKLLATKEQWRAALAGEARRGNTGIANAETISASKRASDRGL
jgi:hypothetical protein